MKEQPKTVLFLDTETSGLPSRKLPADDPSQPHICTIALLLCDHVRELPVRQAVHLMISPAGKWSVEPGAQKVHGMSTELLEEHGLPAAMVMGIVSEMMMKAGLWCAHSADFDLKLIRGELRRLGMPDLFGLRNAFCTMRAAAAEFRSGWPKLADAYRQLLNKELVGAHGAAADVRAVRDIYREIGFSRSQETYRRGAIYKGKAADDPEEIQMPDRDRTAPKSNAIADELFGGTK